MSQRKETLRALVTERLTAAAEEIFALVERTISEYEEELCRSKEENQRKQQLLDSALSPQQLLEPLQRPDLHPVGEELVSVLDREDPPICKQESEQCASLLDSQVKNEDFRQQSSLFQPPQTEREEETAGGEEPDFKRFKQELVERIDISSDSDNEWETAGRSSTRTETESDHNIEGSSRETPLNEGFSDDGAEKVQSHECLACGETFGDDGELQKHMAFHVGTKPFSCPVCGKDFRRKNDFNLHLAIHTGDAPFQCPECDARFALKGHLESHMKGHRAAPLCCPVCNKSFTRKYRLHSHMASHTGERPFRCPVCGRGFTRKDNLGTHMAVHNGKPFICAVCNRCFVRKDRLSAHMASHTAGKN